MRRGRFEEIKIIHRHETLAPDDVRAALEQAKAQIIRIGIEDGPSRHDEDGKEKKGEAQNMAEHFRKHSNRRSAKGRMPMLNHAQRVKRSFLSR